MNYSTTDNEIIFLRESNLIEGEMSLLALKDAVSAWTFMVTQCSILSVKEICRMHKILMRTRQLDTRMRGKFRKYNVHIGGSCAAPWETVPKLMEAWCKDAAKLARTEDEIKQLHIAYEKIHPFADGNGRSGRIILNWQRVQIGLPILIIRDSEKQAYYRWFRETNKQ